MRRQVTVVTWLFLGFRSILMCNDSLVSSFSSYFSTPTSVSTSFNSILNKRRRELAPPREVLVHSSRDTNNYDGQNPQAHNRSYESDVINLLRKCFSVRDIQNVLKEAAGWTNENAHIGTNIKNGQQATPAPQSTTPLPGEYDFIVRSVSLNVLAAALYQLVHFSKPRTCAPVTTATTEQGEIDSDSDPAPLAEAVLERIYCESHVLLHGKYGEETKSLTVTAYGLVDIFISAGTLLSVQQITPPKRQTYANIIRHPEAVTDKVGSIATYVPSQEKTGLVAKLVVLILAEQHRFEKVVKIIQPKKLVKCLRTCNALLRHQKNGNSTHIGSYNYPTNTTLLALESTICLRLKEGDALAKLDVSDLTLALSTLAENLKTRQKMAQAECLFPPCSFETFLLAKALMRRLRKQQVRQSAMNSQLCRALVAASDIITEHKKTQLQCDDYNEKDLIIKEAQIMTFTFLKDIVDRSLRTDDKYGMDIVHGKQTADVCSAVATIFSPTVSKTRTDGDESPIQIDATIMKNIWKLVEQFEIFHSRSLLNGTTTKNFPLQISRILAAINRLQRNGAVSSPETIRRLGYMFLGEITVARDGDSMKRSKFDAIHPNTVNSILRCSVFLHQGNTSVIEPYILASQHLFADDSFLPQCRHTELTNFLWFLSRVHGYHHQDSLISIVTRILHPDILQSFSPKEASSILNTVTTTLSREYDHANTSESTAYSVYQEASTMPGVMQLQFIISELFRCLGEHLLTNQGLSPIDVSSALYAYAKASYVGDMGIFDHLASLMASFDCKHCTTRQMAQSLWACGKMALWEKTDNIFADVGSAKPPYYESATTLAQRLASDRLDDLTPKDIAQSIWAIGRLQVSDSTIINVFAQKAKQFSMNFTSQELANIIWGLSQMNIDNRDSHHPYAVVIFLTNRFCTICLSSLDNPPKPIEAACVLTSLGRMNIRDENIFSILSDVLMNQLDKVSPQAIANALWAYRAVQISPPHQLLNSWAIHKLGIIGVHTRTIKH